MPLMLTIECNGKSDSVEVTDKNMVSKQANELVERLGGKAGTKYRIILASGRLVLMDKCGVLGALHGSEKEEAG